jgi:hypothetical protein
LTVFHCTLHTVATESDPLAAFRAELRRRRLECGFTFAEAERAAAGRITAQRWSRVEEGIERKSGKEIPANPSRRNVIRMATALGWDVNDALQLANMGSQTVPERTAAELVDELARIADTLPVPQRRLLLLLARSMADPATPVSNAAIVDLVPREDPNHRDGGTSD